MSVGKVTERSNGRKKNLLKAIICKDITPVQWNLDRTQSRYCYTPTLTLYFSQHPSQPGRRGYETKSADPPPLLLCSEEQERNVSSSWTQTNITVVIQLRLKSSIRESADCANTARARAVSAGITVGNCPACRAHFLRWY